MENEQETDAEEPAGINVDDAVAGIAESLQLVTPPDTPPADNAGDTKQASDSGQERTLLPESAVPPIAPTTETVEPAPDTWTKEAKEKWAAVPPEVRNEIRKRENDIAKHVGETKDAVGVAKAFEKMLSPYAEAYHRAGINPWKQTEALLRAHAVMVWGSPQQKVEVFKTLAANAGIDVLKLGTDNPQDAANNPLLQHISALQQRINQLEQGVTGVTSTVQAARAAELESSVLAFAQDEASHPFFWEVADDIQRLIQTKAASTLEQAYELALHANPVTRAKLIEQEAEKRLAARTATESEKAAKARKVASAGVRSSGKGRAAPVSGSIDDTLREALANIHSREQ